MYTVWGSKNCTFYEIGINRQIRFSILPTVYGSEFDDFYLFYKKCHFCFPILYSLTSIYLVTQRCSYKKEDRENVWIWDAVKTPSEDFFDDTFFWKWQGGALAISVWHFCLKNVFSVTILLKIGFIYCSPRVTCKL